MPKICWFLKRENAILRVMNASNRYLPALTGIRALAAFWVLVYHLHPALRAFFGEIPLLSPIIRMGYQGVDLFFVLSGFIIAYHYADRLKTLHWPSYRDYLHARLARIYPLHVFMLLTVLGLVKLAPLFGFTINRSTDYLWPDFIRNLFLVQAWQFPAHVNWNHFAWSISAEWFAYLLAPLFMALIWACRHRPVLLLLALLFAALVPLADTLLGDPRPSAYALFRITGAFGLGVIMHRLFTEKMIALPAGIVALLLLAASWIQDRYISGTDFLTVPFSALLILSLAYQRGMLSRVLRASAFDYAGRISYALYITQFVVLMPIKKILPYERLIGEGTLVQCGYLVGIITVAVIAAIAAYHGVEEPARRYLKRWAVKSSG